LSALLQAQRVSIKMYQILFPKAIQRINPEKTSDALAVAVVVSLPWSTSVTAILIGLWLLSALPFLRFASLPQSLSDLRKSLTAPAGAFPVFLWLFAALGMLWADVSWPERLQAWGGFHKLLIIPVLFVQFSRSAQAQYVLAGFLFSCTALLILSWVFTLWPAVAWHAARFPGVPVKDYIAQSGEFVLCAFGSLHVALNAFKIKRHLAGLVFAGLALAFLINVFYVATSRTQLVVLPVLLIVFGIQRFGSRGAFFALVSGAILAGMVWSTSPYLRGRVTGVMQEIQSSQTSGPPVSAAGESLISAGQHLSLLKKSIQFIGEAPLVGHGTGSITELFRQSALGQTGVDAVIWTNPHNQTFAVAIQLGILGAILLYAMWTSHAVLFSRAGLEGWIGTLLVTQNVISCLFNSHLFDFTQGWTYVFGVGVIGGAVMRRRQREIVCKLGAELKR
jgi:O-antigen ligase